MVSSGLFVEDLAELPEHVPLAGLEEKDLAVLSGLDDWCGVGPFKTVQYLVRRPWMFVCSHKSYRL
jgi:hypothetical protein